jgi:formylglycine-generating enzyme required for sulfatase activity
LIRDRSFVVVLVGAVTGVVLARGAGAVIDAHAPVAAAAPVAMRAPGAPAAPATDHAAAKGADSTTPPAHDEGEPDDPHSDADDNPYEESAPAKASPFRIPVTLRDGMLRLPGGHFVMGSASARAPANERPARPMTVTPFWIDRTEVTVDAYRACVDAGSCVRPERASATCTYDANDPDLPVSCVHWADAEAYCAFVGKRLPTEREWEYAARGSYAIPFPWGVGAGACTNAVTLISEISAKSCTRMPARVGSHPGGASVFGAQDMSGNVEEWTADWYVELLGPGPAPRAGAARVLRGGGWLSTPSQSRTTSRDWGSALEAGANVGFRCAKDDAGLPAHEANDSRP